MVLEGTLCREPSVDVMCEGECVCPFIPSLDTGHVHLSHNRKEAWTNKLSFAGPTCDLNSSDRVAERGIFGWEIFRFYDGEENCLSLSLWSDLESYRFLLVMRRILKKKSLFYTMSSFSPYLRCGSAASVFLENLWHQPVLSRYSFFQWEYNESMHAGWWHRACVGCARAKFHPQHREANRQTNRSTKRLDRHILNGADEGV